jgi:hypothetical protein
MTMHVNAETLERHVAGELPAATSDNVHAHISNCLFCAQTLAEQTVTATRWERRGLLGRLVPLPAPADSAVDERGYEPRAA